MTAIALTLLMVAGAILFGIYGRPMAGRVSQAGVNSLADVLAKVSELRDGAIVAAARTCILLYGRPRALCKICVMSGPDQGPDNFGSKLQETDKDGVCRVLL